MGGSATSRPLNLLARFLLAKLALEALHAVDERLVVAGEFEPQVRTTGGELDAALLTRHHHRFDYAESLARWVAMR